MRPGSELDTKIADIVYPTWQDDFGKSNWSDLPAYSTSMDAAMQAFEWLEQHHPWGQNIFLCLCRGGVRREHQSVRINQTGKWEEIIAHREIIGESYAHAICLAVLLATAETRF